MPFNDEPCECGCLERFSDEPENPIRYDPLTNEYGIYWQMEVGTDKLATASSVIYYCPICGGKAPKSRRKALFEVITDAESLRLKGILAGIKTLDEAIRKFGPPDSDMPAGVSIQSPEKGDAPPKTASYRTIVYMNLSETVYVQITDYLKGDVHVVFQGKPLNRGV